MWEYPFVGLCHIFQVLSIRTPLPVTETDLQNFTEAVAKLFAIWVSQHPGFALMQTFLKSEGE